MAAHKIKSDFLARKITFGLLATSKKGHWTKVAKMGQKNGQKILVKIDTFLTCSEDQKLFFAKTMTSCFLDLWKKC